MFSVCCHPEISLPWQRDVTTSPLYSLVVISLKNKTLCERIFGLGRTTGMILRTFLIQAKELSSYLTREDKSFTPLVCWTTQLIQCVPIHNKNSVISRQCLKICTSSMQTLQHRTQVVTARRVRFISAPLILTDVFSHPSLCTVYSGY